MNFLPCRLLAALILLSTFTGLAIVPGNARAETYHTCEGFIDSLPATISTQGVWCLRQNLGTGVTSGNAITIATNNVTIDCNGFKIGGLAAGDTSTTRGIFAENRQNAAVRHCNVRGFFYGVWLKGGAGHLVEDNRADNNIYTGIRVEGENSLVQRNRVHDTGGQPENDYAYGIIASADVIDNTVAGVFSTTTNSQPRGIMMHGAGNVARNNRVRGLDVSGTGSARGILVQTGAGTTIDGNQLSAPTASNGTGIDGAGVSHTVCSNNVTSGFSTAMADCVDAGGNTDL